MAQIIKHRRGSIDAVKGSTARKGELIMATGSVDTTLQGPFLFIGSDDGTGLYSPASKLYAGTSAPNIAAATYGSSLDGTPFYATSEKSLYILQNSNVGNTKIDLTGNLEGNTISGVTINELQSTNITSSYFTGAFVGDGTSLYNIPATGITGLNLAKIYSGSVQVTTDAVSGEIHMDATNGVYVSGTTFNVNAETNITGTIHIGDGTVAQIYTDGPLFVEDNDNGVTIQSDNYAELQTSNAWVWVEGNDAYVEGGNYTKIYTDSGNVDIFSYDGGTLNLNNDGGEGDVNIGNGNNYVNINATTYVNMIYDYAAHSNYLQLYGLGTDDGYWWESGNGDDTTLINNRNGSNLNILQENAGNVNISARQGSVNLSSDNGFNVTGSVNISGNTSMTGALVVASGSATFDSGLVAQNSNMLLTSGSNLIVQNNGNVTVDYIQGNTNQWNYLALNGGALGAPNVELSSVGDISLWAEGGTVNVTGSLKVTGDIVFSGSINIGDYTGDTVNFNGEISSSIIPQTTNAFSLGASGQTWSDVWAENAHFTNISLNTISFSGLTEGRVLLAGPSGSVVDSGSFTYGYDGGYGDYVLTAPIIRASNDGSNGTNFLIGNDMWLGDVNEANATRFMGNEDNEVAKIYLGSNSTNNYLEANYGDVTLDANDTLYLKSQNSNVYLESYDGSIRLNSDSNNNINMYGHTYINNHNLYVNRIWDDSDNSNYLELYGWNTDDGYWWEGGNGEDTTLLNNMNGANLNILQRNNGDVNIDATGGSVNLHSANGFNVTGSMVVSDASGVFNSSLIAYNSDLTLDGGSNIQMNNGAHLYFNEGCGDIYYNTGNDELTLYNDCGNIRLSNNTYINDNFYIENDNTLYTNNVYGWDGGNLDLGADSNLYIHSDTNRYVEIYTDNNESGTNRFKVQESGISLETYDYTSGLTHKVLLDNTGSLNFENVQIGITGSLDVSGSLDVYGQTHIHNDLYVSGNLTILGSGTTVFISSSQIDIGTNIINLNTYAPFERFAGITVYDSGSNVGVTGSLLWDSTNNVWLYANPSGSNYASARFISGPQNTGSLGDETGLTNGHFPIATGDDHISDSLLTYQGTTLALNSNKFTVDSDSGDTLIHGNFTIEGVGGTDNGTYSSYIVFRNDENVLGFVDTSDTTNVTDRLLGYNATTGVLEFSSLIDGGTY